MEPSGSRAEWGITGVRQTHHTGPEKLECTLTAGISSDPCQQQSSAPAGVSVNLLRYHCKGWLSGSSRRLQRTPDSVKDSMAPHSSTSQWSSAPGALAPDCPLRMKTVSLVWLLAEGLCDPDWPPFLSQRSVPSTKPHNGEGVVSMVLGTGWPASLPWPGLASSHFGSHKVAGLQAEGDPENVVKPLLLVSVDSYSQKPAEARRHKTIRQVHRAGLRAPDSRLLVDKLRRTRTTPQPGPEVHPAGYSHKAHSWSETPGRE